MTENGIIENNEIGFLPNHTTCDLILVLKSICDFYKKVGKSVYLCFVDVAKAFHSVNRNLLLYKLYSHKWSTKLINTSYLRQPPTL